MLKRLVKLRNLNWRIINFAVKYYKKHFLLLLGYYISKLRGQSYWRVSIDGVECKLGFLFPYHHLFAKGLAQGRHEKVLLSLWKNQATKVASGGGNL